MDESWYVERRGLLTMVISHVAWIFASTTHARRDVWNDLRSVTGTLEFCVLLGSLTAPSYKAEKGRKPPPSSLPVSRLGNVMRLVR